MEEPLTKDHKLLQPHCHTLGSNAAGMQFVIQAKECRAQWAQHGPTALHCSHVPASAVQEILSCLASSADLAQYMLQLLFGYTCGNFSLDTLPCPCCCGMPTVQPGYDEISRAHKR